MLISYGTYEILAFLELFYPISYFSFVTEKPRGTGITWFAKSIPVLTMAADSENLINKVSQNKRYINVVPPASLVTCKLGTVTVSSWYRTYLLDLPVPYWSELIIINYNRRVVIFVETVPIQAYSVPYLGTYLLRVCWVSVVFQILSLITYFWRRIRIFYADIWIRKRNSIS